MTTTYILMFLWWLTGFCSFVYWWTKEQDLHKAEVLLAIYVAVLGPIAFVIGWFISTPTEASGNVWIKRRK